MNNQEIQKELDMPYKDLLIHLKQKYGTAKENYFLAARCDRKGNTGNSQTVYL